MVAILATALISLFSYFAFRLASYTAKLNDLGFEKVIVKAFMLRWISGAIFTVGQTFMSMLMMCLLRIRFDDFYAEYGCFLWTVVTIQVISLLI